MSEIEEEIHLRFPFLRHFEKTLHQINGRLEQMAVDQAQLDVDIAALSASVDALIAAVGAPPAAADLQPQEDAINALKAKVDAAVPPAA